MVMFDELLLIRALDTHHIGPGGEGSVSEGMNKLLSSDRQRGRDRECSARWDEADKSRRQERR
jgi:hypothetical protein